MPALPCIPEGYLRRCGQQTPYSVRGVQEAVWGRSGLEGPGLSQRQKVLYGLGAVFLRYIWTRADQAVASQHWGDEPRRWIANSSYRDF